MLLDKVSGKDFTFTVWRSSTHFEFRAYKEGELVKCFEFAPGDSDRHDNQIIKKGKQVIRDWARLRRH